MRRHGGVRAPQQPFRPAKHNQRQDELHGVLALPRPILRLTGHLTCLPQAPPIQESERQLEHVRPDPVLALDLLAHAQRHTSPAHCAYGLRSQQLSLREGSQAVALHGEVPGGPVVRTRLHGVLGGFVRRAPVPRQVGHQVVAASAQFLVLRFRGQLQCAARVFLHRLCGGTVQGPLREAPLRFRQCPWIL